MRIIAGEFRGRKLLPPESDVTRPITDRAKQSLFDVLSPRLDEAIVYDCFAGTGSMGLECLSRGSRAVTFFEADRSALTRLRKNIEAVGVGDRTKVVIGDLFKWFQSAGRTASPADLIFLDPPYRFLTEQPDALRNLAKTIAEKHLNSGGIVIFRHELADTLDLPPLAKIDQRTYGSMCIDLLQST
jgi:16S rRNA (guanine966-N2)-methyltransferase